jgi:dynein intermediate chain 1
MTWNPRYKYLFAVAYGSYDFLRQTTGLICCFTIKNPTWPEYSFTTESGVMCIDYHPTCPALIAVGCYDGTVMVFDIRLKSNNKPIYQSTVRTSKHTDPVW